MLRYMFQEARSYCMYGFHRCDRPNFKQHNLASFSSTDTYPTQNMYKKTFF